ncbi:MAG: Uma2 family endonuclease [Bryobacteraceae bacterium]|nr:Uma2 family endonuclease [Bryobacteraceae bacterium]
MAAVPHPPLIPVDEYLKTSYPDGDREYLDGLVVERNMGTPLHSALQKILIVHLAAFEKRLNIAVRPECRTRIAETRYRVPDVLVMARPFRQTERVVLDPPLAIVEILSPDDRMRDTLQRFREYEQHGVRHIIQMDPDERTTFVFLRGDLVRRDLVSLEFPGSEPLPFDSTELLARLDEE